MRLALALLALLAQDAGESALAGKCDSEIPWLTDGVVLADGTPRPPEAPAVDRADLLDRARRLATDRHRLILWYCPRIAGTHMYRAAVLDQYAKAAFFTDPGVVDLIKSKFVPLRMVADEKLGAALGIRRPEFVEPGFILLTPEGRVLHVIDRIRTFNADWLRASLVAVLRRDGKHNAPAGDSVEDLIRGGDDEAAFSKATADQKARICRRAGRYREVLDLDCAPVHKGVALLALGDLEGARKILEKDGSAESLYHLAALEMRTGRDPEPAWKALVHRHPDTSWAWRAASNLAKGRDELPQGPMAHLFEDLFAAPSAGGCATTCKPSEDVDATARHAVEFLLRAQQPDGSWSDARYSYGWAAYMIRARVKEGLLDPGYSSWPDVSHHPNVYLAITAIAATALAEWCDVAPDRIDAALRKAEAYLGDDARIAGGKCEEAFAELFRLEYATKRKDVARMNQLVGRLAKLQDRDGFWGHEYPSAFATAAAVHGLALAKKAGADVPEILFRRAGDALRSTRGERGVQDYRHEVGKPHSTEKNSMGRTAISELALLECGSGSIRDVAEGVDAYWRHREKLDAVRACDNHADEELAGFFYFYAVYHTVEAARALEEPSRSVHLRKFRAQILSLPEMDGSFVDSHELGKSYGTAMALLILNRVR